MNDEHEQDFCEFVDEHYDVPDDMTATYIPLFTGVMKKAIKNIKIQELLYRRLHFWGGRIDRDSGIAIGIFHVVRSYQAISLNDGNLNDGKKRTIIVLFAPRDVGEVSLEEYLNIEEVPFKNFGESGYLSWRCSCPAGSRCEYFCSHCYSVLLNLSAVVHNNFPRPSVRNLMNNKERKMKFKVGPVFPTEGQTVPENQRTVVVQTRANPLVPCLGEDVKAYLDQVFAENNPDWVEKDYTETEEETAITDYILEHLYDSDSDEDEEGEEEEGEGEEEEGEEEEGEVEEEEGEGEEEEGEEEEEEGESDDDGDDTNQVLQRIGRKRNRVQRDEQVSEDELNNLLGREDSSTEDDGEEYIDRDVDNRQAPRKRRKIEEEE